MRSVMGCWAPTVAGLPDERATFHARFRSWFEQLPAFATTCLGATRLAKTSSIGEDLTTIRQFIAMPASARYRTFTI
jgi:hypothetical protein